ncbi:MAG: hypothetical protein ACREXT_18115 [Gammaproteobacteria bacterium]
MKRFSVNSLGCILFGLATAVQADRYQAISINSGGDFGTEKALILDTVAGHMWIWTESPATEDEPGGRYIIYQGQLVPGNEIGDVVLKQEWPTPAAPGPGKR